LSCRWERARAFTRTVSEIQVSINRVLQVVSVMLLPVVAMTFYSQNRIAGGSGGDWREALVLSVASVIGMIPQGLVLLTSMNFAIGSATLARRGVLVQELPAVEVLARVDCLCLDKTGTLTTGGIRVREVDGGRASPDQVRLKPGQGQAGVDDVLDDQNVASGDVLIEVLEDTHDARALGARPVGGDGHPVHFKGRVQLARQVCHNHNGAAQNTNNEYFLTGVVAVNLLGHLAEPTVHVLGGDEDFLQIVSHVGGIHRVLFSYRCSASGCTISVP